VAGASGTLTVRPFGLAVTDVAAGGSPNPRGSAGGGGAFTAAGADFSATVSARAWSAGDDAAGDGVPDAGADLSDNALVPAYAWATTLAPELHSPGGAAGPGTLSGATSLAAGDYAGGAAAATPLRYHEAGSVTLRASARDYLGTAGVDLAGASAPVGRFHPHHFQLDGALVTDACTAGGLTYMGAPGLVAAYDVSARNALGAVTSHYDAGLGYAGLPAPGAGLALVAEDEAGGGTPALGGRLDGAAGGTWAAGRLSVTEGALRFTRDPAGPDGPYAALAIGLALADGDGVTWAAPDMNAAATGDCTAAGDCDARRLGQARVRWGRLTLVPAHGSEHLPLTLPVVAEYWDGSRFAPHPDDDCTTYAAATGADAAPLACMDPEAGDALGCAAAPASGAGTLAAGAGSLELAAPGLPGPLDYTLTAPPWLRWDADGDGAHDDDPQTRASFGLYSGRGPRIDLREVW
jgi:hypothetical protein